MLPSCSPRRDESNGISFDPEKSTLRFDLRSWLRLDLSITCCISYDAPAHGKHIGVSSTAVAQFYQDLLAKKK